MARTSKKQTRSPYPILGNKRLISGTTYMSHGVFFCEVSPPVQQKYRDSQSAHASIQLSRLILELTKRTGIRWEISSFCITEREVLDVTAVEMVATVRKAR